MSCSRNAERSRQIEIAFAVGIPDMNSFGAFPNDGPGTVRFNEGNVLRFEPPK